MDICRMRGGDHNAGMPMQYHASGHKIVRNHKIVRLRILTSILLATSMLVLNA